MAPCLRSNPQLIQFVAVRLRGMDVYCIIAGVRSTEQSVAYTVRSTEQSVAYTYCDALIAGHGVKRGRDEDNGYLLFYRSAV